jgi:hypothetical protein
MFSVKNQAKIRDAIAGRRSKDHSNSITPSDNGVAEMTDPSDRTDLSDPPDPSGPVRPHDLD